MQRNHQVSFGLFVVIQYILLNRKYPLHRYILGVPTNTTALDQHLGGNETLK